MKLIINRYNPIKQFAKIKFLEDWGYAFSVLVLYICNRKIFLFTKYRR